MGRHEVGFVENTEKTPLGDGGKGCRFHSTFQVNKVPGNFHVSTHSAKKQPDNPDFSHKIIEIRMGEQILAKNVLGSFNPLAGMSQTADMGKEKELVACGHVQFVNRCDDTKYWYFLICTCRNRISRLHNENCTYDLRSEKRKDNFFVPIHLCSQGKEIDQ